MRIAAWFPRSIPTRQWGIDSIRVGHYMGYNLLGRTEVSPMPADPDFLSTGRLSLVAFYPVLAPQELRGDGFVRYRYLSGNRKDDQWLWEKNSRRVRRVNDAEMYDAAAPGGTAPFVWDPDHVQGFEAKLQQFNYRFLGEREMLVPFNSLHSRAHPCANDGATSICPDNWEFRRIYIIEAAPNRPLNYGALGSKSILYIDARTYHQPVVEPYDNLGHLSESMIYWVAYRDRASTGAQVAIYPFKRLFETASSATNPQSGMTTMCYLPAPGSRDRNSWYINMGEVLKADFTTASMVRDAFRAAP